jgi:hypothetical protein
MEEPSQQDRTACESITTVPQMFRFQRVAATLARQPVDHTRLDLPDYWVAAAHHA